MAESANYIFLPWVQPGVAANIPDEATDKNNSGQPAVVSVPIKIVVNADAVEKTARLYGPGDVTGIDPQQVIRIEPRNLTTDFEPNYFPAIEFDRPDFPWLFTPAKADAQARLRPWLCLVVVRKQDGVNLRPANTLPLPVLEIKAPARPADELPDLSESHYWSHAQITGTDKNDLKKTLDSDPARSVSRLLCPRKLEPTTEYFACLVPAFDVGCKAGLNQALEPGDEDKLEPAWKSGEESPREVTLPVYYSWEFRTSEGGDFEELVRKLEPRELPPEVGKRPMDINQPGFTMDPPPADAPGTTLGLEGALRVVNTQPDPWPEEVREPFQTALSEILNTPWELATKVGADQDQTDPLVAPPVYGCWQAAVHRVNPSAETTPPTSFWLDELNLDPRNRAVAAMGTRVIQQQQEQLMASAWEQLGEIEKINQRKRQAQLSRSVNNKFLGKSFNQFSPEAFLKVVAPAQSRLVVEQAAPNQPPTRMLLAQRLAGSFVPSTAVSPQLRKITRPRGALNRQYSKVGAAGPSSLMSFFSTAGLARMLPTNRTRGAVTIDQISDSFLVLNPQGFVWVNAAGDIPGHWERVRVTTIAMRDKFRLGSLSGGNISATPAPPTTSHDFHEAAQSHQAYLSSVFSMGALFFAPRMAINTLDIKAAVMLSLDPAKTVTDAVMSSIRVSSPNLQTDDPLDPIMDAPTFPQPMYEALRDLSQDYLFPGLEHVPPNTVQLLQTNAKFIESFLVGLNAEMSRELLWRDYPTDQRGTYFQQFWDTISAGADAQLDIKPIHQWGQRALGTTAVGAEGDKLVLLIRGELLRRYPNTVIYAVKAKEQEVEKVVSTDPRVVERVIERVPDTDPAGEAHPVFRGTLQPDVTFLGFSLTPAEVVDGLGWFFVLQQQPTEPRFGLDDDPFAEGEDGKIPELKTWNDLNWAHLAPSAEQIKELRHASVNKVQLAEIEPTKGIWGRNSAHMAYITKQRMVRIAIHATELLP